MQRPVTSFDANTRELTRAHSDVQ